MLRTRKFQLKYRPPLPQKNLGTNFRQIIKKLNSEAESSSLTGKHLLQESSLTSDLAYIALQNIPLKFPI